MKIIHTADWHIGNRMHRVERKNEFQDFFDWLRDEIKKQDAQALVVSGDIFDTGNPSTESRRQYTEFLASILNTDCKNIIIVGGNHDSGALLDSEKNILNALNIHVVGSIANIEPKDMVVELIDKNKNVIGLCCAVPYARESELRKYVSKKYGDGEFSDFAYGELYNQVLDEAKKIRGKKNIPIIATGHLYASNLEGRFCESENEPDKVDDGRRNLDIVGNLGSVHSKIFSDDFDYVALGHIHYSTTVDKNPKLRYSGSPFVLGFDEHKIDHGVLLVDVEKNQIPKVEKISAPKNVDWIRLFGNAKKIKEQLNDYILNPPEKETNLELYYDWEDGVDFDAEVSDLIDKLGEKVSVVNKRKNEGQKTGNGGSYSFEDSEDIELSKEEIFCTLISKKIIFDQSNLSPEEIKKKENDYIENYLPLFMEALKEFEDGVQYED